MVTNFEAITANLSEEDKVMAHGMCEALKKVMKEGEPIKTAALCDKLAVELSNFYCGPVKINGVKLRKWVNFIRVNSLLPIIGTSNGYFITYKKDIIESQVKSLRERASSIRKAAYGLQAYTI